MDEPYGRLHWGRRPERPAPVEQPVDVASAPAYRVGTSRAEALAGAERLAAERGRRGRAASFDQSVRKAVEVVAREAQAVHAGGVHVRKVVAEKRWIDPEQPFLMVSVQVTPPGPAGWAEQDLEGVRDEVRRMALAVPGGPREVVVFIDKDASGGPSRAGTAGRPCP